MFGFTFVYNLHNARQNVMLTNSDEYRKNYNKDFPLKNWNEFNLFSVKNEESKGTEDIEKLDTFELYNNCEGYW